MTFLPIVERELRLTARRQRTYLSRSGVGLAATFIALGAVMVSLSAGRTPGEIGRVIFESLTGIAFAVCLVAGVFITADCLSQEKRDGTLGLLLMTDMRAHDIVLGKLAVTSLPALYLLFAITPVLGWTFFLGGVSGYEFTRMMLLLVNTLFVSLTAGMFISALAWNGRTALVITLVLLTLITAMPIAVANLLTTAGAADWLAGALLLASPVTAFQLVWEDPKAVHLTSFAATIGCLHLLGWALLVMTIIVLPKTWHEERVKLRFEIRDWPIWNLFKRRVRLRDRAELLDENPVLYLARRSQLNLGLIWGALALTGFITISILAKYGMLGTAGLATFAVVFGVHGLVKFWVAWEATRRFAEDRNSGALELLLTSPIGEDQVLRGWLIGLKRRFLAPIVLLMVADFFLLFGGLATLPLLGAAFIAGMGLFAADTYTLCWVGFWMGLTAPTSTRAFSVTVGLVMMLPTLVVFGVMGVLGLLTSGRLFVPEMGWVIVSWFGVGYGADLALCGWAMGKFRDGFRISASEWAAPPEPDGSQVKLLRQRLARLGLAGR